MTLCAGRRTGFIQNVENDKPNECEVLLDQTPDAHGGVNVCSGQGNCAEEAMYVLNGPGLPCAPSQRIAPHDMLPP